MIAFRQMVFRTNNKNRSATFLSKIMQVLVEYIGGLHPLEIPLKII